MLRRFRPRLTFANVISVIALFVALGGGAYAAFHLPKNSVRSKNIVNGQVKQPDLAGPQKVKIAGLADTASNGGCTNPSDSWENYRIAESEQPYRVGYYRDPYGRVYLQGTFINCQATANAKTLFTLPRGYRPTGFIWETLHDTSTAPGTIPLEVRRNGTVIPLFVPPNRSVDINGLSFRCGPSGKNGCP